MPYIRNCELRAGISMPEGMNRVALGLEYNGETFNGFQKQRHTPDTVQHRLEVALSRVANEAVTLVCAGRTDSGVHASGQVVHFDTLAERPGKAWVQGVNALLPDAIRVHWSKVVVPEFHARFSAKARTYRYIFFCSPVRSAVLSRGVTWVSSSLDFQKMESAAKHLIGEHDFSSFRSSQCQASHAVREVKNIRFF